MKKFAIVLAMVLAVGLIQHAYAASLLGPSPYLSFNDSPFKGGDFEYFYLEDFEDGALNTPGVSADKGVVGYNNIYVDSVDGDDGSIDGSGTYGHSWALYNDNNDSVTFSFNQTALGGFPTHVGIVWTDVGCWPNPAYSDITFSAFDAGGNSLGSITAPVGDGYGTGQTNEDRFLGVINGSGISKITLSMPSGVTWEVDHLQYGFSKAASTGDYIMSNFWDDPGSNDPWTTLKELSLDGNGNGTCQVLYDLGDFLESGSFTYSVNPHRILTINANGDSFYGVMSEDLDLFTIAETSGGAGIDMAIKKSSGMSNSSLTGDYVISEFDDSISNNEPHASLSSLNFDGGGNGTYQQLYVSGGNPLDNGSVTYSVSEDGSLNLGGHHGIVSSDGSVFTATNTTDSYPGIYVGIKKSSGMTNDSLSGDYVMSNFDDESGDNDPWAGLLALRMDGNGNGTFEELYSSGSGTLAKGSCTYSVSPDGMFTVTHNGVVDHGIVSADGGIFTIADTTGDSSGILIGIKNNDFICPSVAQKLSAAGKLFVDLAGYRTKEITNPVKFDEDTSRNKARTKFYAAWNKAENSAKKKGLDCPTEEKETVQGLFEGALEDVYKKISGNVKPSGKDANKLVGDLLKATGIMCSAILNAESANIKKLNIKKLDAAWTKSKATFESSWHKAVAKAGKKGVSGRTDEDMNDVEDIMDNLVIAVSGMGI